MVDNKNKGNDGKGPEKEYQIVVNGREKTVTTKRLSFMDVVSLAFQDPQMSPNIVYTITYKRGHDGQADRPEGTLVQGQTVRVKDGMIFNVSRTDKS